MICVYFMTGAPKDSTEGGSGEAGIRTCDPWFTTNVGLSTTPRPLLYSNKKYLSVS